MLPAKGSLVSGNGLPRNEASVSMLMTMRCKCIRSGTTDIETVCGDQAYERAAEVLPVTSEHARLATLIPLTVAVVCNASNSGN